MNTSSHISSSRHKGLLRLFPVPKFLEMPALGLDISKSAIRVAELTPSREGFIPKKCKEFPLPEGTLVDGEVANIGALIGVLKNVRDAFQIRFVNVSLPDEKSFLFQTQVSNKESGDIRESVGFALEENVPIAPTEALFEYKIVGDGAGSDHRDLAVSVIPETVVAPYVSALEQASLIPLTFEIRSQAIANAVIPAGNTQTFLVLHIGHEKTMICVVERGVVRFSSVIGVGGVNLTSAIARTFQVSSEEAHRLKEDGVFVNNNEHGDFFSSLLNTFSVIKDEMHKVCDYWQEHSALSSEELHKMHGVVLSGKNSALLGLAEYIREDMKCDVSIGDVWTNCISKDIVIPPVSFRDSLAYAAAIGLALKK